MRTLIIMLLLVLVYSSLTAQEGIITKVVDNQNVEINLGKAQEVAVGDKFNVYGKGQFLHPATGRMVDADNIVIGEIELTEVLTNSSRALVLNSSQTILVNARIEKKGDDSKQVSDKPPTQAVYQPEYQTYYSEQVNFRKKDANITSAEYSGLSNLLKLQTYNVKINKGKNSGFRKNFSYFVYEPILSQSTKTGKKRIGRLHITNTEKDISQGILRLRKNLDKPQDYVFDKAEIEYLKYRRISFSPISFGLGGGEPLNISYRIISTYSIGIKYRLIKNYDEYDNNYYSLGEYLDLYGSLHYRLNRIVEPLLSLGYSYTIYDEYNDYLPIIFELGSRFYLLNWLSIDLHLPLYPKPNIFVGLNFHMF